MKRYRTRSALLALSLALCRNVPGQGSATVGAPPATNSQAATDPSGRDYPIDLAGFVSYRRIAPPGANDAINEYSTSVFAGKTVGRFRLHSEFNFSNQAEYESEGINLVHPHRDLSVKLDTATLTYNLRDWLQLAGGFEFVPTYWRNHHYQSITQTVEDPVMDQRIFPTAFKGGMVKGDRYFEHVGFSYQGYGGIGQQTEYLANGQGTFLSRKKISGGRFVVHAPCGRVLEICDVGVQVARAFAPNGHNDNLYGGESRLEKGRVQLLSEFAHASMGVRGGTREYFRQGFYVQGSYRLVRNIWIVSRLDQANLDSRFDGANSIKRRLLGLVFRPRPNITLKLEANQYPGQTSSVDPGFGSLPIPIDVPASGPGGSAGGPGPGTGGNGNATNSSRYGFSTSIVYFYHRP